jgi:glycosyltransferase involved in cell wall biosynthesis
MQVLVSIITPSYNSQKFIAETIRSVQGQTYENWEMIIVDDCSSDKTESIIQDFIKDDARISFYQLQKNSGAGVARNQAVGLAKGRYIAFLDSDDLWKPEKLQKQIDFLSLNNTPFSFSFYECIDEGGAPLNLRVEAPKTLKYDTHFFGKIPISNIRKRQDWMVWLTVLKKIRTAEPIQDSLAFYRVRKDSISSSKRKLIQHNYTVYRQFHRLNVFLSLCCMVGFLFTQLIIKPLFIKKFKPTI